MLKSYNLISLHLFLQYQITFNVLYIKSNDEFASNTTEEKSLTRRKTLLVYNLLTVTTLPMFIISDTSLNQLLE